LEICSTFTIKGVARDAILLCLFPFSLLGKAKQWFYANKDKNTIWSICATAFLAKFFPVGKTNALCVKISTFKQQHDESIPESWEAFKITYQNALTTGWRIGYSCRHSTMGSPIVPVRMWMQLLEDHSYRSTSLKQPL
jgi:hypothetical protein